MHSLVKAVLCGVVVVSSSGALAETPADVFREMDSRKRASFDEVENYTQMKTTMGLCSLEHFRKESTASVDGRGAVEYMRLVPMGEITLRNSPETPMASATPEQLDEAAAVVREQGPPMERALEDELSKSGLPGGLGFLLSHPPSDEPWLSPSPNDMMSNYAMMLEAAAEGKRKEAARTAKAEVEAKSDPLGAAAEQTRIVGNETLNNRPAIRLIAEDLNHRTTTNGQEFVMNTLHLWVDAEKYVPLKMQIDGIAIVGGESRELRIEREDQSYELTPGCKNMYEPQRTVMRIAGILSPKEQADMQKAEAQLADMENQLASLPASQREMIMRQMGPQLEMLRQMASGQGIEVVSLVTGMICNAGVPTNEQYAKTLPGNAMAQCTGFHP